MSVITRREARDAAEGAGLAFIAAVVAIILIGALTVGLWAFGVFTSGVKGNGDLQKQRNSAANRAHWSATFNSLDQQIAADQQMIANDKSVVAGPGATRQDQINLQGVTQNCLNDVAQYNGNVGNTLAVLPAGLPTNIPTTVCGG